MLFQTNQFGGWTFKNKFDGSLYTQFAVQGLNGTPSAYPLVQADAITAWDKGAIYTAGGTNANVLLTAPGTGKVIVTNTTPTTGTTSGAFIVIGGVGIGGGVFVGGQVTISSGVVSTNTGTGALVVNGGVGINGALNAITKSFNIGHPTKPGMTLRYGSLEGPEFGVYVRGRLKGSNTIELPEYWTKLVDPDTITVNLTPVGSHQKLYVEDIVDNTVIVGNENIFGKAVDCFYTVWAERADIDKLQVESE